MRSSVKKDFIGREGIDVYSVLKGVIVVWGDSLISV